MFVFTFFILNNLNLYAQVKIKEKVEIKPRANIGQKTPTGTSSEIHTLKVIANWARVYGPDDVPDTAIMELYSDHTLGKTSTTSNVVELSAAISQEATYCVTISWHNEKGHASGADVTITMYLDGKEIKSESADSQSAFTVCKYVEFPVCGEDAPKCMGDTQIPELKINIHPVGTYNQNPCYLIEDEDEIRWTPGVTKPVRGAHTFNQPYDKKACYNEDKGKWQFEVGPFELNVISGLCNNNIEYFDLKKINSLEELENLPSSELCDALSDLEGHVPYPYILPKGHYIFTEIILKHEEMHVNQIKKIFSKQLAPIKEQLDDINLTCGDAKSESEALNKSSSNISQITIDKFNIAMNEFNNSVSLLNEILTNSEDEVFNLIELYRIELEFLIEEADLNCI